jgi:hypothetical protein
MVDAEAVREGKALLEFGWHQDARVVLPARREGLSGWPNDRVEFDALCLLTHCYRHHHNFDFVRSAHNDTLAAADAISHFSLAAIAFEGLTLSDAECGSIQSAGDYHARSAHLKGRIVTLRSVTRAFQLHQYANQPDSLEKGHIATGEQDRRFAGHGEGLGVGRVPFGVAIPGDSSGRSPAFRPSCPLGFSRLSGTDSERRPSAVAMRELRWNT